jgi:histidine phosphotransferase ChpT
MLHSENALIARICHDIITPLSAISLGLEALDTSGDKYLLHGVKESLEKANAFIKFIRELFSTKSHTFCYSQSSLQQLVANFLEKHRVQFELKSDFQNIPSIAGKIIMYNAIIAKEIIPFGGTVIAKIANNSGEIITVYSGNKTAVPCFHTNQEPDHKNIMRLCLLNLLTESGLKITTSEENSKVIIREQLIN